MTVIENEVTKKTELNEYTYKIVGREREGEKKTLSR
jgi:hypothetical protein